MSDAIEKTAAGATRSFFGALGFILLMVGVEGMTGAAGIQFGVGLFLSLLGGLCFFAFFFWETAKKVLSVDAQQAVGRFSQSRITWFGMVFLVVQTLILSRFVEERRWPFSFPADPAIIAENSQLKNVAQLNQQDAAKWRFSYYLRYGPRAQNNSLLTCKFVMVLSSGQSAWNTWGVLQPMMELAHWENYPAPNQSRAETPFQGIAIISGDNKDAANCAAALGKALGEAFPQNHVTLRTGQVSPTISACNNECVELDLGN